MDLTGAADLGAMAMYRADEGGLTGRDVFERLIAMARQVIADLERSIADGQRVPRTAITGVVRGTGRGVSFGKLIEQLEAAHPITIESPFEGSEMVAGGVWEGGRIVGPAEDAGIMKLRFEAGCEGLPFHTHEHSDRVLIVLEGRGFFHASRRPVEEFDGSDVASVAVRERDLVAFQRGTVHTFSAPGENLTLLSVHTPFVALGDSNQYTPLTGLLPDPASDMGHTASVVAAMT